MSDLRKKRTTILIFKTMSELLNTNKFTDISISQIADTAMIHRNTFYQHFDDKYDLLNQFFMFGLKIDKTEFNIEEFRAEPFYVISKLFSAKYRDIFKVQQNDEQFFHAFSNIFVTLFIPNNDDSKNIWALGDITTILNWNSMNGNPFDILDDYQALDKIYQTRQFPKLK